MSYDQSEHLVPYASDADQGLARIELGLHSENPKQSAISRKDALSSHADDGVSRTGESAQARPPVEKYMKERNSEGAPASKDAPLAIKELVRQGRLLPEGYVPLPSPCLPHPLPPLSHSCPLSSVVCHHKGTSRSLSLVSLPLPYPRPTPFPSPVLLPQGYTPLPSPLMPQTPEL